MSTTNLMFLAPPPIDGDDPQDTATPPARGSRSGQSSRPARERGTAGETLRMTRGAREAATGMGITDQDVLRVLDAADEVEADPNNPARTRFRRGDVSVLTGPDGVVLRVGRERGKRR